ncbi:MAG: glycosyltransferase, partial [Saprospiraceae bacterium]|nr:glycosyltransferase [Saprospiraceae bacterium]
MIWSEYLFWILGGIVIYTFLGYGLLLWLLVKLKTWLLPSREITTFKKTPSITLIIAAYNEIDILVDKITNCQALNYPTELLEIWFITDGSTDGSELFLKEHSDFKVFHRPQRAGKTAAINRIMPLVTTDMVVFTDANTFLDKDALINILKPFKDPQVGCVAGEKRVGSATSTAA